MRTLSIVIPALNERENLPDVMASIPREKLSAEGWDCEIVIVDNGSTDGTADLARSLGAKVVVQPVRGYGNAYKAGFANSAGAIIATGDADCTYPFEVLPELLSLLEEDSVDFINTDRLSALRSESMTRSHVYGNRVLSRFCKLLFGAPFNDSQSGMWVLRRTTWEKLNVVSGGMAFSQEIKVESYLKGLKCLEVPIDYRPRGGEKKLNTLPDGFKNMRQLVSHRVRAERTAQVRIPGPRTSPGNGVTRARQTSV